MTTGGHHQILTTANTVGHRGCVGGKGQALPPDFVAAGLIKGAQVAVGRRADKNQSAGGCQRTAGIGYAGFKPEGKRRQIAGGAQRHLPFYFTGFQIHGGKTAPGFGYAGGSPIRDQRRAQRAVSGAFHRKIFEGVHAVPGLGIVFVARDKFDHGGKMHLVDEHQAGFRIYRNTAPVDAADIGRVEHRAFQ